MNSKELPHLLVAMTTCTWSRKTERLNSNSTRNDTWTGREPFTFKIKLWDLKQLTFSLTEKLDNRF